MPNSLLLRLYFRQLFRQQTLAYVFAVFITNLGSMYLIPGMATVDHTRGYYSAANQHLAIDRTLPVAFYPRWVRPTGFILTCLSDHVRVIPSTSVAIPDLGAIIDTLCSQCRENAYKAGLIRSLELYNCKRCEQQFTRMGATWVSQMRHQRIKTTGVNQHMLNVLTSQIGFWRYLFTIFFPATLLVNHLSTLVLDYLMRTRAYQYVILPSNNHEFFYRLVLISLVPTVGIAVGYIELAKYVFLKTVIKSLDSTSPVLCPWSHNYRFSTSLLLVVCLYILRWLSVTRGSNTDDTRYYTGRIALGLWSYLYVLNNRRFLTVLLKAPAAIEAVSSISELYRLINRLQTLAAATPCYLHVFTTRFNILGELLLLLPVIWGSVYLIDSARYQDPDGLFKHYKLETTNQDGCVN